MCRSSTAKTVTGGLRRTRLKQIVRHDASDMTLDRHDITLIQTGCSAGAQRLSGNRVFAGDAGADPGPELHRAYIGDSQWPGHSCSAADRFVLDRKSRSDVGGGDSRSSRHAAGNSSASNSKSDGVNSGDSFSRRYSSTVAGLRSASTFANQSGTPGGSHPPLEAPPGSSSRSPPPARPHCVVRDRIAAAGRT